MEQDGQQVPRVTAHLSIGGTHKRIDDMVAAIRGPVRQEALRRIGERGLTILRQEMPEGKTGDLRAKAQFAIFQDSAHKFTVGWWSSARTSDGKFKDKIVDQGKGQPDRTKASPGRYVPAIGRRLLNRPNPKWQERHGKGLYHGTRGTKALTEGIKPYGPTQYIALIKEALRHFGKSYDKLMTDPREHDTVMRYKSFRGLIKELKRKKSYSSLVYASLERSVTFDYAHGGPEKLTMALQIAGVDLYDISNYITERFGAPTILEIRGMEWKYGAGHGYGGDDYIGGEDPTDIIMGTNVPKEYVHRAALGGRPRRKLTTREQAAGYARAKGWEFPAETKVYRDLYDPPEHEIKMFSPRGLYEEDLGPGEVDPTISLISVRGKRSKRWERFIELHEFGHAVDWARGGRSADWPPSQAKEEFAQIFAREAGKGKYAGVGWHPGSKRTPFYRRSARKIRRIVEPIMNEVMEAHNV